jgi:hypothetical protein
MMTTLKFAAALAFAGVLAVTAVTPSQAAWHARHSAVRAQDAYSDMRAPSANDAAPYGYAYEPAPGFTGSSESSCMVSPGSANYSPCDNH